MIYCETKEWLLRTQNEIKNWQYFLRIKKKFQSALNPFYLSQVKKKQSLFAFYTFFRFDLSVLFLEANPPADEEKRFYNDCYESIFAVLFSRFTEHEEAAFKKGAKELVPILEILKKLLLNIPNIINNRWEIDKIGKNKN